LVVLPILRAIYKEFLPPNKDLDDYNKYPATVVELLSIHAELCKFYNVGYIYFNLWLDHFYKEHLLYFVYREQTDSEKGNAKAKKRSPVHISRQK